MAAIMAMRWSLWESTVPPISWGTPSMMSASRLIWICAPRLLSSLATVASLSDSLMRRRGAVGDHRAALCNGGDCGDDGDQIRDVLGAHLETAEFVWTRNGGVGGAAYAGAKARQGREDVAIALGGRKREPVDLDGSLPSAPAHSQKAALDQSPSTVASCGVR